MMNLLLDVVEEEQTETDGSQLVVLWSANKDTVYLLNVQGALLTSWHIVLREVWRSENIILLIDGRF
jgi:hypothetical protein